MPIKQAVAGQVAGQVVLILEGGSHMPKMAKRRALGYLRQLGPVPGAFVTAAYPTALKSLDSARRFAHAAGLPFRDGGPAAGSRGGGRSRRSARASLSLLRLLRRRG